MSDTKLMTYAELSEALGIGADTARNLVVEGERDTERARATLWQAEAATAPALRQTVEELKGALDSERDRARDLRAERDTFLRDPEQQMTRRSWWPFRRAG